MPPASWSSGRDHRDVPSDVASPAGSGWVRRGRSWSSKKGKRSDHSLCDPRSFSSDLDACSADREHEPSLPPCGLLLRALSRPQPSLSQMCAPRLSRLVSAWLFQSAGDRNARGGVGVAFRFWCSVAACFGACGFLHFLRLRFRFWGSALSAEGCRRSLSGQTATAREKIIIINGDATVDVLRTVDDVDVSLFSELDRALRPAALPSKRSPVRPRQRGMRSIAFPVAWDG